MIYSRQLSGLTILACAAFMAVFAAKTHRRTRPLVARPATDAEVPDSVRLARIDLAPGRQLIAYVIGGSRCGTCQSPDVKTAFSTLRDTLRSRYAGAYRTIRVVAVAINTDVHEGLEYLRGYGPDAFDEISVGAGWQNELAVRLMWRLHVTEAGAPQIVLVARTMTAQLSPMTVNYGGDSLVAVIFGRQAIGEWMHTPTPNATPARGSDVPGAPLSREMRADVMTR